MSPPSHIPVLLYHCVRDVPLPGLERWTVTPARFRAHVTSVARSGRTALTMSALADGLRGRRALPPDPVAITFDDGTDDTLRSAETVLTGGLPLTAYVQLGRLGGAGWLDARALRALDELGDGVELGSHTIDHPRVDELSGTALDREVAGSKAVLEDLLGHAVAGFAYPHGAHDARSRDAAITAGYTHAAAVKNALSHPADDPFAIARWTVEADTPAARIEQVLAGERVPLARARPRLATTAYRRVRRLRRRLVDAALWR